MTEKLGEYVADYNKAEARHQEAEAAGDQAGMARQQAELDKQRFPRAACLIDMGARRGSGCELRRFKEGLMKYVPVPEKKSNFSG